MSPNSLVLVHYTNWHSGVGWGWKPAVLLLEDKNCRTKVVLNILLQDGMVQSSLANRSRSSRTAWLACGHRQEKASATVYILQRGNVGNATSPLL